MMILQNLLWGPAHGYGISQAIRAASNDVFQVETGSLYPALHRLQKKGWLTAEWKTSEKKQRAKYYRLTLAGRKQLGHEQSRWKQIVDAVASLAQPQAGES